MVHEREVGELDLAVSEGEDFRIDEIIVAHVIDLDPAVMILLKEFYHVVLTVSEQLVEALTWQSHRNNSICDVAQI